ncbi:hypothetical protein C0J52_12115 [Blattella germanica]|nr:hypothetical protein C0J52_12115 [Blattella germanica]
MPFNLCNRSKWDESFVIALYLSYVGSLNEYRYFVADAFFEKMQANWGILLLFQFVMTVTECHIGCKNLNLHTVSCNNSVSLSPTLRSRHFPKDKYELVKNLKINGSRIHTLEEGVFSNMPYLEVLNLKHNLLERINCYVFANLTLLTDLNLSFNKLKFIDKDSFMDLIKLQTLHLDVNELSTLDDGLFNNLVELRVLFLSNNKIKALPDNIFLSQSKLSSLFISNNELAILPKSILKLLSVLQTFDLRGNNLLCTCELRRLTIIWKETKSPLSYTCFQASSSNRMSALALEYSNNCTDISPHESTPSSGVSKLSIILITLLIIFIALNIVYCFIKKRKKRPNVTTNTENPVMHYNLVVILFSISIVNSCSCCNPFQYDMKTNLNNTCNLSQIVLRERLPNCEIYEEEIKCHKFYSCSNQFHKFNGTVKSITFQSDVYKTLAFLSLSNNGIQILEEGTFDCLKCLMTLDLSNNSLQSFPGHIFDNLLNLTRLDLSYNKIKSLKNPELFKQLTELEVLNLEGNDLSFLNNSFSTLIKLIHLNLANNRIILTLDMFKFQKKLAVLDLKNNNITIIEKQLLTSLSSSTNLLLDRNPLNCDCKKNLTILPDEVELRKLSLVSLKNNSIKYVKEDIFRQMENLLWLDLSNNSLESLLPHTFQGLDKLCYLDLSQNNIKSLTSPELFMPLEDLEFLNLEGNGLTSLNCTFSSLEELKTLELGNNRLTSLPEDVFKFQDDLNVLDLHNNCITRIEKPLLTPLKSLNSLILDNNPLHCDCQVLNTLNWWHEKKHKLKFDSCLNPSTNESKKWSVFRKESNCNEMSFAESDSFTDNKDIFYIILFSVLGILIILLIIAIFACFLILRKKKENQSNKTQSTAIYHVYDTIQFNTQTTSTVPEGSYNYSYETSNNVYEEPGIGPSYVVAIQTNKNGMNRYSTLRTDHSEQDRRKERNLEESSENAIYSVTDDLPNADDVIQRLTRKRKTSDSKKLIINSMYGENI